MSLEVKITLVENTLKVASTTSEPCQYAFYVYYYASPSASKTLVYEGKYGKENEFAYEVKDSGYYYVRCFAQNEKGRQEKNTDSVLFLNEDLKSKYKKVIDGDLHTENTINDIVPYHHVPHPQNDFCIISYKKKEADMVKQEELKKWCGENEFELKNLTYMGWNTNNIIMYSTSSTQKGLNSNGDYIFSGYVWDEDKFYFGQDDIPSKVKAKDLFDKLGVYTLLSAEKSQIRISQDYYSYGGVYYYLSDEVMVAANNYHLLLLTLSKINKKYELDNKHVYTTFASNVTFFRTPCTTELVFRNTFKLNLVDEIVINRKGWKILKRPSYEVFLKKADFNEKEYNRLIEEGKNEIVQNVKAVLNNKRFENFVLELSGGKDSRATLAALSNLDGYEKQFKVWSNNHEPNDLDIAAGIVNLLGLSWQDFGYKYVMDDILENIKKRRSCFMGMRYLWYVEERHENNLSKMVFNTDSFESLCVRYYSRNLLDKISLDADMDTVLTEYVNLVSRQAIIDYSKVSDMVREKILQGLNDIPGNYPMEKFDNMFMFYRGNSHAGNLDRMYYGSATCVAAQSKSLLYAKRMWINNFEDNKVIYDITYSMNPILASIPYNNTRFNEARKRVADKLYYADVRYKNINIQLDMNKDEWQKAKDIRDNNTVIEYASDYVKRGKVEDVVYENCLLGIQKLARYNEGVYLEDICLPLLYYVEAEKADDVEVRLIHNKINSILDCIDAIQEENLLKN